MEKAVYILNNEFKHVIRVISLSLCSGGQFIIYIQLSPFPHVFGQKAIQYMQEQKTDLTSSVIQSVPSNH